jgi:hypothetical protein
MNLLKKFKFKVMILGLFLMSLSFGSSYANENYDSLVGVVKAGKFAKFKKLYESSNLAHEQKIELVKIADGVIETEKKKWPKDVFGNEHPRLKEITKIKGKEIEEEIKMLSMSRYIMFIAIIPFSFFGYEPIKKLIKILSDKWKIQKGVVPLGVTAVSKMKSLEDDKKIIFSQLTGIFGMLVGLCGSIHFLMMKEAKKMLANYKRYKGASKIKKHLEGSLVA